MIFRSAIFAAMALAATRAQDPAIDAEALAEAIECNKDYGPLELLLLENEEVNAAVEDDIRRDLAKIGFTVKARTLSKSDINDARQAGDFHFSISETWGTPYDPNSFASGWIDGKGGEGIFPAMVNFNPPASRSRLLEMVEDVLKQEDKNVLQTKWNAIHNYYHAQAVMLPLWGKRIPTLLNSRLTGYEAGFQQFDYPIHRLQALEGPDTITIAPGARTGMFKTVGDVDAHTYGPNEFFSNNWVYEGLVAYGQGGQILPSLATKWTSVPNNLGGDTYTFTLREGVQFHDGSPWNCEAAKLNFDHVLAGGLRNSHGWYGIPRVTEDWSCVGDYEFVIRTNAKHGPYLQELTLIRPIRMISPGAFVRDDSNSTDAFKLNSCNLNWGTIDGEDFSEDVICAGIAGVYGTGPYQLIDKDTVEINGGEDSYDRRVIFQANENHWSGAPAIKRVEIVYYETSEQVKTDLLNGDLDVVWGSGVLSDADIKEIEDSTSTDVNVFHSEDLQNVILLLNSGKPPLDDINVRKTIIHSINKAAFVEKELKGLQTVVDNVFPKQAPYCDVDLTPRWDYDFEKAVLLSQCKTPEPTVVVEEKKSNDLAAPLGFGLGIPLVAFFALAIYYFNKTREYETQMEKKGEMEDVA